jgi:hypothetical protein
MSYMRTRKREVEKGRTMQNVFRTNLSLLSSSFVVPPMAESRPVRHDWSDRSSGRSRRARRCAGLPHNDRARSGIVMAIASWFAVAAISASVFAARTDAYLYWTTAANTIARAANDGTQVNLNFIEGTYGGVGVAVDANHVYWGNASNGSIGRANLDGSGVDREFITGGDGSGRIAVDEAHIYWVNACNAICSIGRADLNGQNVNQNFMPFLPGAQPDAVAVNSSHIFWSDRLHNINEANLDGTGRHVVVESGGFPLESGAAALALDANYIYWADGTSNAIGRANLDGSNPIRSFIVGAGVPDGVAVDAQYLYWANSQSYAGRCGAGGLGGSGTLGRSFLSGTNVNQDFETCANVPNSLAVDALAPTLAPNPTPPTPCCTPPAVVVPVVSNVRQSVIRWREGNKLAHISRRHKLPVGTTFKFSLNTSATVSMVFTQTESGHDVSGRCLAGTGRGKKTRKCTFTLDAGKLGIATGHAGVNTVGFWGRLTSSEKLRPGRYTLLITASTPTATSPSQSLMFTITK